MKPSRFNQNSKAFKRDYNRLFKKSPESANILLLLCEIADDKGRVETNEEEISILMNARFNDPRAYQLSGRANR